jgi:hypothetical protein
MLNFLAEIRDDLKKHRPRNPPPATIAIVPENSSVREDYFAMGNSSSLH